MDGDNIEGVQRVDMNPPKDKLLVRAPDIIKMEGDQIVGFQPHLRAKTDEEVDEMHRGLEKGLLTIIPSDTDSVERELPLDSNFATRSEPRNVTPTEVNPIPPIALTQDQERISKLRNALHRINPFKNPAPLDPSIEN